jgi:hypothetical protein
MNSYLRAALNARAVRTAYNVMNQYRLLVESMMKGGAADVALEGVRHMIYYGRTSYDMQLGFVTETVAYSLWDLDASAHAMLSPAVIGSGGGAASMRARGERLAVAVTSPRSPGCWISGRTLSRRPPRFALCRARRWSCELRGVIEPGLGLRTRSRKVTAYITQIP